MKSFWGYLDNKFNSGGDNNYTMLKIAQLSYAAQYTIGILLAYALRLAGINNIYETQQFLPTIMFVTAYSYLQVDRIGYKFIPPIELYSAMRILAFALMLTTLSQTAFNIIVFAMAATFIYIMTAISYYTILRIGLYFITPTLVAHAIYCGLLFYRDIGFGFDLIAGWFILISVALKISIISMFEQFVAARDMGNKHIHISFDMEGQVAKHPISFGYQLGKLFFQANILVIFLLLLSIVDSIDQRQEGSQ